MPPVPLTLRCVCTGLFRKGKYYFLFPRACSSSYMLTPSRRLPLLIYQVASILVIGFAYTQIRVPVGAAAPGYAPTLLRSHALRHIDTILTSMSIVFLLGFVLISWP